MTKGYVLTLALLAPSLARAQEAPARPAGDEHAAARREPFRDAPGVTPIHEPTRDTAGATRPSESPPAVRRASASSTARRTDERSARASCIPEH